MIENRMLVGSEYHVEFHSYKCMWPQQALVDHLCLVKWWSLNLML